MTRRTKFRIFGGVACLVLLLAAGLAMRLHEERREAATKALIAVVVGNQQTNGDFLNGIHMAVERVNAEGGLLGKTLIERTYPEPAGNRAQGELSTVRNAMDLAARIVDEPGLVAVIGHNSSDTAIPASSVYDEANVPFFATHATNTSLSRGSTHHVYGLLPNDQVATAFLARYALTGGMRNFIVLGDISEYGKESSDYFAAAVTTAGGSIAYKGLIEPSVREVSTLVLMLLDNNAFEMRSVDGIFVVGWPPESVGQFVKLARQVGILTPILGTDSIISADVARIAGPAMKDVVGISLFDPDSFDAEATAFTENYRQRFGALPSNDAAVGYDSVRLITAIVRRAGNFDQINFSNTARLMRYDRPFRGVTGQITFNTSGMIANATLYVVRHDGKAFNIASRYSYNDEMFADLTSTIRAATPSFRHKGIRE